MLSIWHLQLPLNHMHPILHSFMAFPTSGHTSLEQSPTLTISLSSWKQLSDTDSCHLLLVKISDLSTLTWHVPKARFLHFLFERLFCSVYAYFLLFTSFFRYIWLNIKKTTRTLAGTYANYSCTVLCSCTDRDSRQPIAITIIHVLCDMCHRIP